MEESSEDSPGGFRNPDLVSEVSRTETPSPTPH